MPGDFMKKRHLFLSLLLVMGCSDKKPQEDVQDLDRIVQECRVEIDFSRGTELKNEEVMK
jgi:Tfp pilus assembly protein PilP